MKLHMDVESCNRLADAHRQEFLLWLQQHDLLGKATWIEVDDQLITAEVNVLRNGRPQVDPNDRTRAWQRTEVVELLVPPPAWWTS